MRYLLTKLTVAFIAVGLSAGCTSAAKNGIAGESQPVSDSDRSLSIATQDVTLNKGDLPLSNSVKWQTMSKEYQTIARGTYQLAEKAIMQMEKPAEPWVVVMDIDETVLDNSAYQVGLDTTGESYSKAGWANWVKSEKATLTPGAATFIEIVLREGGKIGLITNRDASLNEHTWRNLLELGLPLTAQNACLLGRSQADITAVDNESFLNDKDLRRSHIASGNAVCFKPNNSTVTWNKSHKIVMQIGDNIEDFKQVTQEHADVDVVLTELNKTLFLLPNPMYGSW